MRLAVGPTCLFERLGAHFAERPGYRIDADSGILQRDDAQYGLATLGSEAAEEFIHRLHRLTQIKAKASFS